MGLIRTLVDRVYKINNSWLGFLILFLRKNLFPVHIVQKIINRYLSRATIKATQTRTAYCTNIEIKLAFSSFNIGSMFSVKDPVPLDLRSRVMPVTSARLGDISRRAFVSI